MDGQIYEQALAAVRQLLELERVDFNPVELLVIGCSSSEIAGGQIGHASQPELGEAVARAALSACAQRGVACAFQCCEHLNRALVVERATARAFRLEPVCVVPQPKAGGSCAAAAFRLMDDPVVVERIQADAGIDIGDTMIGMHLRPVAVPVRLTAGRLGQANLVAARTRPKLIGGPRARYQMDQA